MVGESARREGRLIAPAIDLSSSGPARQGSATIGTDE
jgi:hypothetical protein